MSHVKDENDNACTLFFIIMLNILKYIKIYLRVSHYVKDDENDNDDEYNALNDETFGSAAVVEDWEDNHEQLAFLSNTERLHLDGRKVQCALYCFFFLYN